MIYYLTVGTLIAAATAAGTIFMLRKSIGPILLSIVALAVMVCSPFVLFLLYSPLGIDAMMFWLVPVLAVTVTFPFVRFIVQQCHWSTDEKRLAQKVALWFLWGAMLAMSVGGASMLVLGKRSEVGLLIAFAALLTLILCDAIAALVLALTI